MELWIAFWLMCGVASAVVAHAKSRSVPGWFVVGLATGVFGLIMIACMPSRPREARS